MASDDVAYFFNLAVEQYTRIKLYFTLDKCVYSNLEAMCIGVKKGHVITRVSLANVEKQQIVWGSDLTGYFTVRDDNLVHCHFASKLARLYNAPPDALYLIFPLPQRIDHQQRRFSRRVNLDEEIASDLSVWHGEMQSGDLENLPALRWIAIKSHLGSIGEISANGLRLDVPEKSPMAARMSINDTILLRGNFGTPSRSALIFVLGNVVRKMADPENEEMLNVGCHFISWRRVDDTQNNTWFRADPQEGIGLIAQWISRNYRNLY